MRSEEIMYGLIMDTAQKDERIRGVILNGSRVNPQVKGDVFQDFDIVYVVTEIKSFLDDPHWIDIFGEMLICQEPSSPMMNRVWPMDPDDMGTYTYLMQFADGNRIDLTLRPLSMGTDFIKSDSLTRILLDKDGVFPEPEPPSLASYSASEPDSQCYYACRNEFFWVSLYVAKGLCRQDLLYAKYHLDEVLLGELLRMMTWEAGFLHGFPICAGKCGKNLKSLLPDRFSRLTPALACTDIAVGWHSLWTLTQLFQESSEAVAGALGTPLELIDGEEKRVLERLREMERMPLISRD